MTMAYSPFSLRHDEIEALRAVRDGRGHLEVERDISAYIMGWAPSDTEASVWIGFGMSEEEARADLAERLETLAVHEEMLDEIGVMPHRYRDLVEAVHAAAENSGIDRNEIDDVAIIREWERHSETSAANWLIPDDNDITRLLANLGRVNAP